MTSSKSPDTWRPSPSRLGETRAATPDANTDPFTVAALCAASALADLNADADMVEVLRYLPAEQGQVVGLVSNILDLGMTESGRVIVDKIFKDDTAWRNSHNLGQVSSTIFG